MNTDQTIELPRFYVALAGNPNAGKTTLFNALTGLGQKVANYPGVTVERKEGTWKEKKINARVIDLPGLYSLDTTSIDEGIARDVLVGKLDGLPKPDVLIAVVDATNLERNLYLVTQLFEYGIPVVVALTVIDVFEKQKHKIDIEKLSRILTVPVVAVDARHRRGLHELAEAVAKVKGTTIEPPFEFSPDEGAEDNGNAKIFARYNFISDAVQESVVHNDTERHRISEKIDKVLTHKVFGLIVLLAILLLIFRGTNPLSGS